mmetsp:Transcript_25227/g.39368  ORF Transcript_25227/g.39368 Transcript_25227/m.39368 type:complete len:124 (-) Transcript_25227:95-466(-)|eukprot:CAMPEP_0201524276 /NCGR_PEP_ID=MMETSP0161_2-20130828/21219_1 /ASSEMBLY_ACC=CAM_ASM_000251 /TAXON_ID=180227 /ORGANISM="Neoparamoeba aestuarina, Strain SoJaBio B1-5/56/2" /LENGTH=123 /DNA_ID=CAMNT_0047923585 /DNA_START=172 /DNA_END=543 /DNA_ORIENTATION=-
MSSSEFPLPEAFLQSVLVVEDMGFQHCRKRVIELLIQNGTADLEPTLDTLLKEKEQKIKDGKAQARKDLLELLDSKFGDSVLENMAELSLRDCEGSNSLSIFLALAINDNDVEKAHKALQDDE